MSEDGNRAEARASQAAQLSNQDDYALAETAHDFGNLLQCATSALRVSRRHLRESGNEELAQLAEDGEHALERAALLAWRLAGISQPERTTAPCSVPGTLASMERLLRHVLGARFRLEIEASAAVPRVRCQIADLENAVLNLVMNAREAMPEGGRLLIKVQAAEGRDGNAEGGVTVTVTDTGCGMTRSTAEKAFDRSFSTKGESACHGLGLASVRRFATDVGGSVGLTSRLGHGTTVILFLPAVQRVCR